MTDPSASEKKVIAFSESPSAELAIAAGLVLAGLILGQSPRFVDLPSTRTWPLYFLSYILYGFAGLLILGVATQSGNQKSRIRLLVLFLASWAPLAVALTIYFGARRSGWQVEFWWEGVSVLVLACLGVLTISLGVAYLFYTSHPAVTGTPVGTTSGGNQGHDGADANSSTFNTTAGVVVAACGVIAAIVPIVQALVAKK
jgi:hypothetical protein